MLVPNTLLLDGVAVGFPVSELNAESEAKKGEAVVLEEGQELMDPPFPEVGVPLPPAGDRDKEGEPPVGVGVLLSLP